MRAAIIKAMERRIADALRCECDHKRDDPVTRSYLQGYTTGLNDALYVVANVKAGPKTEEEIQVMEAVTRLKHVVPQGLSAKDEMIAIRTLLVSGRIQEARERLDIWLDRYQPLWRTGGSVAWD